jgi:hypothetical protein
VKKLTCYACDGDFAEGVWINVGGWMFYCKECHRKAEERFPSWKYAKKRYLTKDNNTVDDWGECIWCSTTSHDSIIEYDDNGEQICPECKRAGGMKKL